MSSPLVPTPSLPEWFETELVTRGTEIDFTATVGMPVVLRYFELLRWGAMVEPAFGLRALIDAGHFFVVRSQTIELRERIGQSIPLRMRTRIQSAGRSTATVIHEAHMTDGTLVARARVLGVWLGPDRRIARLPDHFRALFSAQFGQYGFQRRFHGFNVVARMMAKLVLQGHAITSGPPPRVVVNVGRELCPIAATHRERPNRVAAVVQPDHNPIRHHSPPDR